MLWRKGSLMLAALATCALCVAAEETKEGTLDALRDPALWSCARASNVDAVTACLEQRARALFEETSRQAESTARSNGDYPLLEKLADVGADLLPDALLLSEGAEGDMEGAQLQQRSQRDDEDDLVLSQQGEQGEQGELGRGKKKKKRKAIMKLLFVGMLIKNKLQLLFQAFGALLQIKFFGIAVLQLLISLFRLYLEIAKKKEPQKVIYYEHAQHQHHYDHDHYDHDHDGHKGWSLWGRSYEEPHHASKRFDAGSNPGPDANEQAYSSYYPRSA